MPVRRAPSALGFVALILGFLLSNGCRSSGTGPEWGWKTERPAGPLQTFSHDVHRAALEREGFQCYACHTMTARIEDAQEAAAAIRASKATFFPGKETCHFCHYNPQVGNVAPDRCGLCHVDVREIQPANHNYDWTARHAVFAKADGTSCNDCHRPSSCENCHKRRDQTVRTFHDRNVRFVHGIEARANPMQCGQCHLVGFCTRCHVEGGYEQ